MFTVYCILYTAYLIPDLKYYDIRTVLYYRRWYPIKNTNVVILCSFYYFVRQTATNVHDQLARNWKLLLQKVVTQGCKLLPISRLLISSINSVSFNVASFSTRYVITDWLTLSTTTTNADDVSTTTTNADDVSINFSTIVYSV